MIGTPAQGGQINWRAIGRYVLMALAVAVALYVASLIPKTIAVFVVATLIAYGLNPVVKALSRRMSRTFATIIAFTGLILAMLVALVIIVPAMLEQIQRLIALSPEYIARIQSGIADTHVWLSKHLGGMVKTEQLSTIESNGIGTVSGALQYAIGSASAVILAVANGIIIAIFGLLLAYFLLANAEDVKKSYYSLFPDRTLPQARVFAHEVSRAVGGFIIGQVLLMFLVFVMTLVALLIVRAPFPVLLAIVAAFLYAIPYVGVVIACTTGFLLGLLSSWKVGLLIAILIAATSKIADFAVPKIMGDNVGVSPMAIIFAVFAGGELFGFWGLILGIPAAAVFKVVWTLWLHPWLTGRPQAIPLEESDAASAPTSATPLVAVSSSTQPATTR